MAKRSIKVIWGGAEQIPGEWKAWGIWGVYERDPGSRVKGLALSVRGVLRFVGVCLLASYLAGAIGLYVWFARNPYNQVTLLDTVLLPVRWSHVREVRGRMMIAEGLDDLKAKRWGEANFKLTIGLIKAPHDLRARLALAQFNLMANRRTDALKILTEDLDHGYPGRKFLELMFSIASEGEEFDLVVSTCDRFAKAAGADASWLTVQRIQALVRGGRADEVASLPETIDEQGDDLLREARLLALLELKRPAEAVAYLDRWSKRPKIDGAQIARLQVRAYREAGDLAGMERAWNAFRALAPSDARTYAYGVVQRALAGQTAEANAALDDYFLRFSGAVENIALLAGALVEAKAPALVERCMREARAHGFAPVPLEVALLQAQLATGDWTGASRTLARVQPLVNQKDPMERFVAEWLTNLVGVVSHTDQAPEEALLGFLRDHRISMRIYRQTCEPLVLARKFAVAQQVLELAERAYPASKSLGALRRQVTEGLKPPPTAVVAAPVATVVREKAFFESLERAQQEKRWAEAAQAIRELRVQRPAWLKAREPDLLEWQMRIAVQTGDLPELLGAATFYLDGSTARAVKTFEMAQELDAKARREDARRLIREIFKKNAEFPAATRLLKQWDEQEVKARAASPAPAKK